MYEVNNFYTISKASELIGVKPHVLRFWEKKIQLAKPNKMLNGRRYYSSTDIKNLLFIKKLLYVEGFTIKGVINLIDKKNSNSVQNEEFYTNKKILEIKNLISEVKYLLIKHTN